MAELKREQGKYKEAATWADRIAKVKDSLSLRQQSESILRLQNNMEKAETEKYNNEKQNRIIFILFFAITGFLMIIIYHKNKIKTAQSIISEHQARIEEYSHKIEQITASGRQNEREINRLKRKTDSLREEKTSILNLGRKLHGDIENGGTTVKWGRKEFEAYVELCRIEHPELTEEAEKGRGRLTAYNMFFLMLCGKGIGRDEIQRVMGLSSGALRTLKYRLRRKDRATDGT